MSFDFSTLITDRKKSDADYALALIGRITNGTATAEELAEWNAATLKGVYGYTDLNRVTAAMDEINNMLSAAGYKTGYQKGGEQLSVLPDGYTQLEYIESTGVYPTPMQYIDTGVVVEQNDLEIDATIQTVSDVGVQGWFFTIGRINTQPTPASFLQVGTEGSKYKIHLTNVMIDGVDSVSKDKKDIVFTLNGQDATLFVDSLYSASNPQFETGSFRNQSILLFYAGSFRIFAMSIKLENAMVRSYIPCKNSSGKIGLYDTINKQFYGNDGTSEFIAGPEVIPEPVEPFVWKESDNPTLPQLAQYLENVRALRSAIANQSPDVPGMKDMFSVEAANNIEKILLSIQCAIQIMKQTYVPCGATACGGDYL